jgi:hypothetical protein
MKQENLLEYGQASAKTELFSRKARVGGRSRRIWQSELRSKRGENFKQLNKKFVQEIKQINSKNL